MSTIQKNIGPAQTLSAVEARFAILADSCAFYCRVGSCISISWLRSEAYSFTFASARKSWLGDSAGKFLAEFC